MDLLQDSAQTRVFVLAILSFRSAARFTTYLIRHFMYLNSYICNRRFVWVWNLVCYDEVGMSERAQACCAEENGWGYVGGCGKLRNEKLYYALYWLYCDHQTKRDGIGWECSMHIRLINAALSPYFNSWSRGEVWEIGKIMWTRTTCQAGGVLPTLELGQR
jgi:hypothetical protein